MDKNTEQRRDEQLHWSFDKRINLAHILTTLALAAGLATYLVAQEKRMTALEQYALAQKLRDERQDLDVREAKADVSSLFKDIKEEIRMLRTEISAASRKQ